MRRALTSSLLSLGLLTACSVQQAGLPQGQSPRFQLVQFDTAGAIAVNPASQEKPTTQGTESLVVNISQFIAKFRRVLAVPAAVHKVVITVTAADGTVFTEILDLAALTSGQTSVTFNGLVPGDASILIEAYDAANQVIGSSRDTARVTPGAIAQKEMSLPIGGTPSSGGSGGGSSGPSVVLPVVPSPGDLSAQVGLLPGPTLAPLTPWKALAGSGNQIAFDAVAGKYWTVNPSQGSLQEVTSNGDVSKSYTLNLNGFPGDSLHRIAIDHAHHFWLADRYVSVIRVSPTGQVLWWRECMTPDGFPKLTADLLVDAEDHAWLAYRDRLVRVSPGGDLVKTVMLDEPIDFLAQDANTGVVWGMPRGGNWVLKVEPAAGATRYTIASKGTINGVSLGVDATGHVWLPRQDAQEVLKLAPDGTVAARFPLPGVLGVFTDNSGNPWIFDQAGVYRLGPDGRPGDGYAVQNATYIGNSHASGTVWLKQGTSVLPLPL